MELTICGEINTTIHCQKIETFALRSTDKGNDIIKILYQSKIDYDLPVLRSKG
jgi:hypothetical protein